MAWYYIVLIVIGWIIIGGLVTGIANRAFHDWFDGGIEDGLEILTIALWPILLGIIILVFVLSNLYDYFVRWIIFSKHLFDKKKNKI